MSNFNDLLVKIENQLLENNQTPEKSTPSRESFASKLAPYVGKIKSFSEIEKSEGSEIATIIAIERHKFYRENRARWANFPASEPIPVYADFRKAQKAKILANETIAKQAIAEIESAKKAKALAKYTATIHCNLISRIILGIVEVETDE